VEVGLGGEDGLESVANDGVVVDDDDGDGHSPGL
jgi:hypothetical protein